VNATGQWTDRLFDSQMCRLSKGVHILLPSIGLKDALLLLSPIDERVFFALPWYGKTMIGTTDTDFKGDTDKVCADEEDLYYLLESFNHYLNDKFKERDIISSFAGLRVLKNDQGHPSSVTRDWEWREVKENVFVSLGGKLTSAREDSCILIDHICNKLNSNKKCQTHDIPFPWAPKGFEKWESDIKKKARELNLSEEQIDLLISRQGKRCESILQQIENKPELKENFIEDLPFTKAELFFVLEQENVRTFTDLARRRFPLVLLKKMTEKDICHLKEISNEFLISVGKEKLIED
ncbi:MAG: FAD-dependent oxidoreductase, partial [Lentisphaeraceae bacterium]|nr:FAD-dependent oxidoreductase [Lentisphaeraceae bacterium]